MLVCACRRGKIVASLGPATWQPEAMARLLAAGVDVVRFNVKHQSQVNRGLRRLHQWPVVNI
jgi:pyruvate kinase